jgi:hypothetical protein
VGAWFIFNIFGLRAVGFGDEESIYMLILADIRGRQLVSCKNVKDTVVNRTLA